MLTAHVSLMDNVPFPVKRLYWIYGVPSDGIRGTHAHRLCQEYLLLLQGQLTIHLKNTDGESMSRTLTGADVGLYIPPLQWKEIRFSANSTLLVAASEQYDPEDYIYEEEFNQLCLQVA